MIKNYSVLKAVESQIRRIKVFYPGKRLDQCDQDLFHDILLLEYRLIEDLLPSDEFALRQFRGFLGTSEIDILKYAQTLKFSDSYLKNSLSKFGSGEERSLQSFKHSVKDANLYWGLMKPFEKVLTRFFESGEPCIFQLLNTWINFSSRVNFRSLDLTSELQLEYFRAEREMESWEYEDQLILKMREVMSEWLKDFTLEHFVPQHGPGSVAGFSGRLPVLFKHQLHQTDARLDYFYSRDLPLRMEDYFPFELPRTLIRTCELVFVPKTMIKNRVISKEPVSLQYTQQGVKRALYRYFKENAYLSSVIDLESRELSQEAARKGSICGEYDTLDLSNASDSVSLSLIKRLFKGTSLYRALICTRSDNVLMPSGRVLRLNKFAPMGSSLCFPVETLVFACICEVASRLKGHKFYYRIYGDDIVCSHELSRDVIDILVKLNFSLNEEKSFFEVGTVNFREACGGEYINGVDVSPLRVSRKFVSYDDKDEHTITSADTVQSYVSFANNAFERGMYNVRRGILSLLEARFPSFKGLLFAHDSSHLNTFDDSLTNWKLQHRFRCCSSNVSDCYQYVEYGCLETVSREDKRALTTLAKDLKLDLSLEGSIRLFEYFRSRLDSNPYEGIQLNGLIIHESSILKGTSSQLRNNNFIVFLPEQIKIRPTRAVMHWKWAYFIY